MTKSFTILVDSCALCPAIELGPNNKWGCGLTLQPLDDAGFPPGETPTGYVGPPPSHCPLKDAKKGAFTMRLCDIGEMHNRAIVVRDDI